MPSSACRRGGGEANAEARRASWLWGSGSGHVSVAPTGDGRQQWPRPRPREAHAAAHLRIVPVDAPSTPDQPPELRLIAVPCGLIHVLVHRVAHCARRALQAFARSDSCAFGGGHARLRGDDREAAARTLRRGAHAARPHAPRSSGAAAAVLARGRVEDARSDHGAQSRLPHRLAPEAPSSVVWACGAAGEAAGEAGPRAAWCGRAKQLAKQVIGRDQGIGIGRSPARGCAKLTFSIGIDFPVSPTLGRPSL